MKMLLVRMTDVIAGSTLDGSEVIISEDAVDSVVNVFTEDILPKIFNNLEIFTTRDLFNFCLVNRIWRDAATLVLLKHNMYEIALDFGNVTIDEDGNAVIQQLDPWEINATGFEPIPPSYKFYKYFNVYQPRSFLSELNQLFSTSLKFPSF